VKLGVRREAQVELLEGVSAGEQVVTAGIRVQRDGQPVRVIGAAPASPGAALRGRQGRPAPAETKGAAQDAKGGASPKG